MYFAYFVQRDQHGVMRVHNRFGGMRDLAFFRGDIRDLS